MIINGLRCNLTLFFELIRASLTWVDCPDRYNLIPENPELLKQG